MDFKKPVIDLDADDFGSGLFLTPERTDELARLTMEIAKRNVIDGSYNKLLILAEVQHDTNDIQEYTFVIATVFLVAEKILINGIVNEMSSAFGKALSSFLKNSDDE